jgi:hypothetical protein
MKILFADEISSPEEKFSNAKIKTAASSNNMIPCNGQ